MSPEIPIEKAWEKSCFPVHARDWSVPQFASAAGGVSGRNAATVHTASYPRNLRIHQYADYDRDLHSCWRAVAM